MAGEKGEFVSRAGVKLAAALERFGLKVGGYVCADLGCSVGGFTDCVLKRGAAKVYAVDTAYGQLAWTLRNDPRVVVMERSNALHVRPGELCDLVTIDLGWTVQAKAIPAALRWLKENEVARIITLIKPHYESKGLALRGQRKGKLSEAEAEAIMREVVEGLPALGVEVVDWMVSPIAGGKGGNAEYLALVKRGVSADRA
jgi:23S rRNA (cytidine1920-2'-O)/16S rRNA (cytidine1409-2'-O)-methyltransferase